MYRTECTMFDEVYMGNPGKVPYCNERDQFEPDCTNCERPNVTQADKIRSMTDEELAAFFAQQKYRKPVFDGWLPLCNYVMGPRACHKDGCEKCWLDWLRQEG